MMNIGKYLERSARNFPGRPAVSVGSTISWDYSTLARRSFALAAWMKTWLAPGETVAIASHNCPEYLEILNAIWAAGLVAAPMNAKLTALELHFMLEDSRARLAFVDDELAGPLSLLAPDCRMVVPCSSDYKALLGLDPCRPLSVSANDSAWIFYTSGTTGNPKGALLSHGNLNAMAMAYLVDVEHVTEHSALLHLAATSHASGLFGLSFLARAANNVLPESGGYDAAELTSLIDNIPGLSFFVPPTLLRRMATSPHFKPGRVDHMGTVLLGAAPVTVSDLQAGNMLFGARIWNGYGQGESPCTITAMSRTMIADAIAEDALDPLASVGIARYSTAVRVVGSDGSVLPPGEVGEVVVRGPTVMKGYLNRPEETETTLKDGWLQTGDLGKFDERGFLTLLDRKKDMIISGGTNIYACEIENRLIEVDGVAEVAVVGWPDQEWGETVAAFVVRKPGSLLDHADLDRHCLGTIARFKRPKNYIFVDELPKNSGGKVLKKQLRNWTVDHVGE